MIIQRIFKRLKHAQTMNMELVDTEKRGLRNNSDNDEDENEEEL